MQSPLDEELRQGGAFLGSGLAGGTAEHFGDPEAEYREACRRAALFDLSRVGMVVVRGRDRVRYLHNMLSNDIKGLGSGCGCYATLLTHQGKMETDLWVYRLEEEIRLELPAVSKERALASLGKYIVADDVRLEERPGALLSLQGPLAAAFSGKALDAPVEELEPLAHLLLERSDGPCFVVRRDRTGLGGCDLWLPSSSALALWRRLRDEEGIRPAGALALDQLRTEAGIPWYGRDMDERTLPMEVGLRHAISLNKGCYRGQEIVARVHYRGSLDRSLGGIAVRGGVLPPAQAEVRCGGEKAGRVTSAVFSPRLGCPLALAILERRCLEPGTQLEIVAADALVLQGETIGLPL